VAGGLLALNRGGQSGWSSPAVLIGLAAVPVLGGVWIVVERRAESPALDPRLFRSPSFAVANVLSAAANATMFMIWLLVPYYLLSTRGYPTVVGGLLLAANPLAMALIAPVAGRGSGRFGAGRVAVVGLAVQSCGLVALSRLGEATPAALVALSLGTVGLGIGLFTVPNMSLVMGSISREQQGVAGALTQMARTVGVVSGVALGSLGLARIRSGEAARTGVAASDPATFLPAFRTVFLAAAVLAAAAAVVSVARAGDREPNRPGP
jgi:predicted MFS family arabinose efflux permease